ncbi:MAG: class II fumarate hydratase [Halanaerobiaceae bacterium]
MDSEFRIEQDSLGEVKVPEKAYYGAQTERSRNNFPIGSEKIPEEVIKAYGKIKLAAARANHELGRLSEDKLELIEKVSHEIITGELDEHFPLVVWQTGSGTQTNMNINEVISNRASELAGFEPGSHNPLHPNDDVNMSQSSNDTFPTAMSLAATLAVEDKLIPALNRFYETLEEKSEKFSDQIKTGRTHLMDATPVSLGQEFSGYASQIKHGLVHLEDSLEHLKELAIGGTAVGTGLNAPEDFAEVTVRHLNQLTGLNFKPASNKFEAIAAHDSLVNCSGALKTIAASLIKIANDIRWLASGPRCGLGEIEIPANEPGSSIMPGKVNPTQAEALLQVSYQVLGNDTVINLAGSSGNFELNVAKPVMIYNLLQSINLLADALNSFEKRCLQGLKPLSEKLEKYLNRSLMLVTALTPLIGYEKAAEIANKAHREDRTLKEVAVGEGYLTEEEFEENIDPASMI